MPENVVPIAHTDPLDWKCTIASDGGLRELKFFAGFDGWSKVDAEKSLDQKNGRVYGINSRSGANGIAFTLMIRDSASGGDTDVAGEIEFLETLDKDGVDFAISMFIPENLQPKYKAGTPVKYEVPIAWINPTTHGRGSTPEAGDLAYPILGMNAKIGYKT